LQSAPFTAKFGGLHVKYFIFFYINVFVCECVRLAAAFFFYYCCCFCCCFCYCFAVACVASALITTLTHTHTCRQSLVFVHMRFDSLSLSQLCERASTSSLFWPPPNCGFKFCCRPFVCMFLYALRFTRLSLKRRRRHSVSLFFSLSFHSYSLYLSLSYYLL